MVDWWAILEDEPEANPANWIDGVYVGPAMALVMRARARHEAMKDAHDRALRDRRRERDSAADSNADDDSAPG
jgi:hypothetical protein